MAPAAKPPKQPKPPKKIPQQFPLELSYSFDNYLMYMIQEVTGKESIDILAFFSDLGKEIARVGQENRTGRGIKKTATAFFPDTSIPFQILVEGDKRNHRTYDHANRVWNDDSRDVFACSIAVSFPSQSLSMPQALLDKITEALIERELLGREEVSIEPFDRPIPYSTKMYVKMMEEICGKQPKREKKVGYDPNIVGVCRNCNRHPKDSWRPCECDKNKT